MSYSFVDVSIAFRIIIHVELKISSNKFVEGIKSFVKDVLQLEAVSIPKLPTPSSNLFECLCVIIISS